MTTQVDWFFLEKIIDLCEKTAVCYLLLLMASQNERIVHSIEKKNTEGPAPGSESIFGKWRFFKNDAKIPYISP